MPTISFNLPEPKAEREEKEPTIGIDDDWRRRVSFPVNQAILDAVSIGDEVTITLRGTVTEMNSNAHENHQEQNLGMKIHGVDLHDYDSEDAEGDFERGFNRLSRNF